MHIYLGNVEFSSMMHPTEIQIRYAEPSHNFTNLLGRATSSESLKRA